jgi:CRISPR/Cas system endoribonuclease Cas6 (RAMP superfamily)
MTFSLKDLLLTIICPKKNWKIFLLYNWNEIIGALHTKVRIEKIYDDTLILSVFHSSWMQELYLLSPLIIKTINEKLEQPYIKQIRFKQSSIKKKRSEKQKNEMFYKKNVQLTKKEEYILTKITDPTLREALKAFRIRCYRES